MTLRSKSIVALGLAAVAAAAPACGSHDASGTGSRPDCGTKVDRFKEMLIVDEGVLGDARASNRADGPWSFRALIEQMVPEGTNTSDVVLRWLRSWLQTQQVNQFAVPSRNNVTTRLICPWLKRTEANHCDDACGACDAYQLDLAEAPFQLIGIVNRMDLVARGPGPQIRFVFGGFYDAEGAPRRAMDMTVTFDYRMTAKRSPAQWAQRWHALAQHPAYDDAFKDDLASLLADVTTRGADPSGTLGSALFGVHVNERAFDWDWSFREFRLTADGSLQIMPLDNTPDSSLNSTSRLTELVSQNSAALRSNGKVVFPTYMLAGSTEGTLVWSVPQVSEDLRHAFAQRTCNGCHGGRETTPIDLNFHVSPHATGLAKVSKFLHDPSAPDKDDLAVREGITLGLLCNGDAPAP